MRTTLKDFSKRVEVLEEVLGIKLNSNIWHKHYSVYTCGENNVDQERILSASTAREAVDQINTILNVLYIQSKRGTK